MAGKTLVKKLGTKVVQKEPNKGQKGTQNLLEGAKLAHQPLKSTSRGATNQFQKQKFIQYSRNTTKIEDNVA